MRVIGPSEQQQALKRQIRQTLEQDRLFLLTVQPFTGQLLMQLELVPVVDDRLPTAATDGYTIFANAEFMHQRSAADRRFILAHEVWHCVVGHPRRRLSREPDRWNRACDYEVNARMRELLSHCPEDALFNRKFAELPAERIYDQLPDNADETPLDDHDIRRVLNRNAGTGVIDPDFNPEASGGGMAEPLWDRRIVTAAHRTRDAGRLPSDIQRRIEQLHRPVVPWTQVLARFVERSRSGDRQWSPPSRRHLHRGLYMPARRGHRVRLTVALDNSGSCQGDLTRFVSEFRGVLGSFDEVDLRLLVFDTDVRQDQHLQSCDLHQLDSLWLQGGGGTDFRPVFETLANEPSPLIMLTDGMAPAPSAIPNHPVLWVMVQNTTPPVAWGEQLSIR